MKRTLGAARRVGMGVVLLALAGGLTTLGGCKPDCQNTTQSNPGSLSNTSCGK